MKTLMLASLGALLFATSSFAQSETPKTSQTTPAIDTENNPGAPVAGKNSFTESQARSHIEKAGYKNIQGLKLDSQGVWRATASKNGKSAAVSLDFQGNVTMAK
ncbi:PepSY domain-containing protein [Rhizobium sp. P38BS-XIX]|uniref:PepSY domain-containing protein n=1 Tax=Rhizobium sp. P38BS-XIX TaxID=2726740 RepID=UPI001456D866|nr:PepSY domain-containing protein [Rhizobium sp. P38BS-XIX]NLS00409.1 PepSY domain-containing protein [Rhizobium sp. P38BS-XIX]